MSTRQKGILVEVILGDLAEIQVDTIALKHATESLFGVEIWIDNRLDGLLSATYADNPLDKPGEAIALPARKISAKNVLVVGVGSLYRLTYRDLDTLARNTIQALSQYLPETQSLATTVHGRGIGLDPAQSLKSQILGFASALQRVEAPPSLSRLVVVEQDELAADLLKDSLQRFAEENPDLLTTLDGDTWELLEREQSRRVEQVRYEALKEPTVFVAMPFSRDFRNIYDYGIRLPILNVRRKPIRIDEEHFTGSIIAQVKEQIRSSEIVVADMTGANPNVFFEVDFAKGVGKRTVLLCQDPNRLPFDVRGDVHLVYEAENIRDLEDGLTEHLKAICR